MDRWLVVVVLMMVVGGPGGARLNLAWGIPLARGDDGSHGGQDLKVGPP